MAKNLLVDEKIERAIIGALLKYKEAIFHALHIPLKSNYFGTLKYRTLYDSCLSLFEAHGSIDPYMLLHFLKKEKKIEVEERDIAQVIDQACEVEQINGYIKLMIEFFFRREIKALGEFAKYIAENEATDAFDIPQKIQERMDKIVHYEKGGEHITETGKRRVKQLEEKKTTLFYRL